MEKGAEEAHNHRERQNNLNCDPARDRFFWDHRNVDVHLCINNHHLISLRKEPLWRWTEEPEGQRRHGVHCVCLFWCVWCGKGDILPRLPFSDGWGRSLESGERSIIALLHEEGSRPRPPPSVLLFHGLKRDHY